MKKVALFVVTLFLLNTQLLYGQLKIGYVDSDTILKELPDAQDAQKKLDGMIQEWQDELKKMERELKEKQADYEKRKLIMSEQKRIEVEKDLSISEKAISDFRQKKFGVSGELYASQEEVMKPVQNKIFTAIQEVADDEELDFVFDRSGDILFLYAKDEYDITHLVLEKLK
ncbi:MAG: OmpH family outer membrane protein [Melioribacteraceae bacterium]|nr:OmpH family outer membrane protein [Melioribacteraceae bacterium]